MPANQGDGHDSPDSGKFGSGQALRTQNRLDQGASVAVRK